MSIRFTLTNRNTGAVTTVDAPRRGEHVKDGVVKVLQPSARDCNTLMQDIKSITKLGAKGAVLT